MAIRILALLLILAAPLQLQAARPAAPPDGAAKPSEVVWSLEEGGLVLSLQASQDLNFAYGSSLALSLCLYQLSDMAKFQNLASSPQGVAALVQGDRSALEGTSLISQTLQLQPGQEMELTWDRMEGARYFALAAGYAHQDPKRSTAWKAFPVEKTTLRLRRRRTADYYTAGTLALRVLLGAQEPEIQEMQEQKEQ